MENFNFDFEKLGGDYKNLIEQVGVGNSCSIFGVQNSMRPALVSSFKKKILYIAADLISAKSVAEQFEIMNYKTFVLEPIYDSFIYKHAQSNEAFVTRSKILFEILKKQAEVIVVPVESLFNFLPSIKEFKNHILKFKTGENIEPETLQKLLVEAGYKREELLAEAGQFSRRGEVFDIFPINADEPYRIDFFDTEIESIKVFDLQTQKGTKEVKQIEVCPFSDLFLTDDELKSLIPKLEKLKLKTDIQDASLATIFNSEISEIISRLELGERGYTLDVLSCFLDDFRSSIFDFIHASDEPYLVVIDECKRVFDSITSFYNDTSERLAELKKSGMLIAGNLPVGFGQKELFSFFERETCVAFLKITNSNKFFKSKAVFNFRTNAVSRYTNNLRELSQDISAYIGKGFKILIFAETNVRAEELKKLLISRDIEIDINKSLKLSDKASSIVSSGYHSGFIMPDEKIIVFGTYDIFPKKRQTNKLKISRENVFSVPKVGDYVVHHYHGIGVCEGVTELTGSFGTQDYVVIRYAGGDKLYVPTSHMDMLDRFSGAEKPSKLSKIGGQDFSAVKNKVKESIKKLAFNLVELYAKREKIKGFAFIQDNELQSEFENSFAYVETEDQLTSIEEIKKDMESQKVMDRLLCGDVGFGKTEVALRAIFKAVSSGKQVAFIAPTTILSEQHYNTARARMFNFGVNIEVLNRFKTKAQTEKIIADIASGKVDVVCGTHRVLSDDVVFKDLGLIVLDEEQKFGVEDKEKLKNKYPAVDVLTLSATPIPRTLSMSLSGIRDISIISTPPSERLPIQTYVSEYSETLVKDAVNRELSRNGQVFILFNSVEKIFAFAEQIRRLIPEANVAVAHGQMNSKMLEQIIYDFYHQNTNVLICTTIIENGIDIENANTLIVYDSDKLGLSQLYQIRGRVGRGSRVAYAYFTYRSGKILTEEAYKRLDAISEFCEFGSGFKLAMRDLEIRGSGNILGAEQSGHLQKIGYDMYSRLLSDAIKELRGEKVEEMRDVLVKIAINAFVPDTYISTSEDRMVAYKRISTVSSLEDVSKLETELVENYGKIPKETENLIQISLVRQLAKKINATEIVSIGSEIDVIFEKSTDITGSHIIAEAIYQNRFNCSIDMTLKPMIKFNKEQEIMKNFLSLKKILVTASKLELKFDK